MNSKNKKVTPKKSKTKKISNQTKTKDNVSMNTSSKKTVVKSTTKKNLKVEDKKILAKGAILDKEKIVLQARSKKGATPSIFKIRSRKNTPIVFSLEEVQDLLKNKSTEATVIKKLEKPEIVKIIKKPTALRTVKKELKEKFKEPFPQPKRVLGAASLADILGFNPNDSKSKRKDDNEESKVPKHLLKYYKSLVDLRQHVLDGLEMHSKETLKRSSKEDAGDLSAYGQHMADAGTDTFDRDFALNLLSSEQDALFEIEEAIQRIIAGTYGICEITGVKIANDRLMAVPFTRYGLEGQKQLESTQRVNKERGSVFGETSLEESAKYVEDFED